MQNCLIFSQMSLLKLKLNNQTCRHVVELGVSQHVESRTNEWFVGVVRNGFYHIEYIDVFTRNCFSFGTKISKEEVVCLTSKVFG